MLKKHTLIALAIFAVPVNAALAAGTAQPAKTPPPPSASARLDTGSYIIEGENLTWAERTGEFTIPKNPKFTQPGTDVTGDRAAGNSLKRNVTITGHVVLHNSKPVSSLGVQAKNAPTEAQTLLTDQLQVDGPAKIYTATGNVKFMRGAVGLGTVTLSGGVATVTTTTLPAGSDPITANYLGAMNYGTSSASLTQVVQ